MEGRPTHKFDVKAPVQVNNDLIYALTGLDIENLVKEIKQGSFGDLNLKREDSNALEANQERGV